MSKRDDRLTEELRFHLEQQIEKNIRKGMSPQEARRDALVKFGGVDPTREAARDQMRGTALVDFWRDLRLAFRSMARGPAFAASAVLTFALGVTASVAMYSVFEGVLLRPLPMPNPDALVQVYQLNGATRNRVADPNFLDWQQMASSFSGMSAYAEWGVTPIIGAGEAQLARMTRVDRSFFDVMGARPIRGRVIRADEQVEGAPLVAVVGETFWRRWRGDADPAGEVIRIGNAHYTIVGVMPESFTFPRDTSVWTARGTLPPNRSRTSHNALVVARLKDGTSLQQANTEISAISRQLKTVHGDATWMTDGTVISLLEATTQASRPAIELLFVASLVLLLVATTNLSNLLVVRASARRAEFALQLALGATPMRLARQIVAESLALCLTGALVGIAGAMMAVRLFVSVGPATVARLNTVSVSWPAVAFAVGIATLAALVVTMVTVFGSRSTQVVTSLAEQGRSGSGGVRQARVREALIVAQVALTLVLLAGAALLGRSLMAVMSVNPGFSLDDGLVVELTVPADDSASMARRVQFHDQVIEQLKQQPGVTHVGLVSNFPLGFPPGRNGNFIEMIRPDEITTFDGLDRATFKDRTGSSEYRHVSGDYFQAMGIPLVDGRFIDARDTPDGPQVAVVSRALAEKQWPGRSALGRWIQFGNMDGDLRGIQVVGVVGDVRELSPESPVRPMLYVSARQRPRQAGLAWVIIKGPQAVQMAEAARRIVKGLNPEVPATTTTITSALELALRARTFTLWLVGAFGAAALVLAVLGVYGLMSYVVGQRTREMGIRLALGAEPRSLVYLVLRRGVALAAIGAVVGVGVSQLATGMLDGFLFQVDARDPGTLAAASIGLLAAATVASYLPARRLLKQSPARTLRDI